MSPLLLAMSLAHAATCTVQSSASAGPGTLRRCINDLQANATTGDTILVDVPRTILPVTALPDLIEDGLTIDGAGLLTLDGSLAPSGNGLTIVGADGVAIVGVQVVGFPGAGIDIQGGPNTVIGGTGADENALIGNDLAGIRVGPSGLATSAGTIVGGNRIGLRFDDSADGNCVAPGAFDCAGVLVLADAGAVSLTDNVISGNLGDGVRLHADNGTVHSNVIGVSASGTFDRGNTGDGIVVSGALIPGTGVDYADSASIAYNLVSGNGGHGVHLAAFSRTAGVGANGIGVDIAGAPLGNDSNGVHIASLTSGHSVTGTLLAPQVIGANGASGVVVGGYGHIVAGNHVGVTATPTPASVGNAAYGIRVASGSALGAHQVGQAGAGNVVAGNDLGGIWVDAPDTLVSHNIVGLGGNEATVLPNGTNTAGAASHVFGGLWVTAAPQGLQTPPVIELNLVAGNDGHGIWVQGGQHPGLTEGVVVDSNDVGVDGTGADAGNDGDGLRIEGAGAATATLNLVAGNTGAGIHVLSSPTHAAVDFDLIDNDIGTASPMVGNDGHGIWLELPSGGQSVANGIVANNTIAHNGEIGITATGGANYNELTQNLIHSNGACALRTDEDSHTDDGKGWPAPTITAYTATSVSGATILAHTLVARVEVYEGADKEAGTYLGDAQVAADGTWVLANTPVAASDILELRALVVSHSGTSSDLTHTSLDGCEPEDCDAYADNQDADWCSFYRSDGTTCVLHERPVGYPCSDHDPATGYTFFGDTALAHVDQCGDDSNGDRVCLPGPVITPDGCPFATGCNAPRFDSNDPDPADICRYEPTCGATSDGICSVDDLNLDGAGCVACADTECDDLFQDPNSGADLDTDGDGFPDSWEDGDYDWDCDGTEEPVFGLAEVTIPQTFLLLTYMSENCSVPQNTVHSHKPGQAELALIADAFVGQAAQLVMEIVCVPHYEQISMAPHLANRDPDCNDAATSTTTIQDLKTRFFEPWRHGIYRFGVIAHGAVQRDITTNQQSDLVCTSNYDKGGDAEIDGDDFRIYKQQKVDSATAPTPDHAAETYSVFHELGHTFGLTHGGPGQTNINNKPNYQSAINYRYTTLREEDPTNPGSSVHSVVIVDYSIQQEDDLDETNLYEADGFTSQVPVGQRRWMTWDCPPGATPTDQPYLPDGTPADWNCDGYIEAPNVASPALDLNGDDTHGDLYGVEDWSRLNYVAYCAEGKNGEYLDDDNEPDERGAYEEMLEVELDIVPGCSANAIADDDAYPIEAVLMGNASLDVSSLKPTSLGLAGGRPRKVSVADVDSDGHDDLLMRFVPSSLPFLVPVSEAMLFNGITHDNRLWWAKPTVDVVADPCAGCPGAAGCP